MYARMMTVRIDQRKLDEYLTSVREVELRIEHSERFAAAFPDYAKPDGIPADNEQHLRLLFDMLALAFQTDTTRVATFLIAHDGSNRPYPAIGVADGYIAAIAVAHGLTVATRGTGPFKAAGVPVIDPWGA